MTGAKEKHPSWFKLKTERRQLIKEMPPETAVNVLLACLDFLEVGSFPKSLRPIEKIAASAFLPDLEEAWATYEKRVNWGSKGGRPPKKNHMVPHGSICSHKQPCETEVEEDSPNGEDSSSTENGNKRDAAFVGGPPPRFYYADGVLFLFRDDYYTGGPGDGLPSSVELTVAKNRHGQTGEDHFNFWLGSSTFREVAG